MSDLNKWVMEGPAVNFICVYKTGGDYDGIDYVDRLRGMVHRNLSVDHRFICLTDDPDLLKRSSDEADMYFPLIHGWEGWWSLIEIFRFVGPCMMMGLDTVIVDSLDPLADFIKTLDNQDFAMIKPFSPGRRNGQWASGITAWNGDWYWLYNEFKSAPSEYMQFHKLEQMYTCSQLISKGIKVKEIQSYVTGVKSFKRHCYRALPKNSRIVLFHGPPRPHEVKNLKWLKERWVA